MKSWSSTDDYEFKQMYELKFTNGLRGIACVSIDEARQNVQNFAS